MDNSPRSISDKSIQASENKGTKQSSNAVGGSKEVVSDGALSDEEVQDMMHTKNVTSQEASGGVVDKAPKQKKTENSDDDPKIQSGVISAVGTSSSQAVTESEAEALEYHYHSTGRPRSSLVKSIQASKNKGTKQSINAVGGSQEVVTDGAVGDEGMKRPERRGRANKTKARSRRWRVQKLCLPLWHKKDRMW